MNLQNIDHLRTVDKNFNRRSATRRICYANRGMNPTATLIISLRENCEVCDSVFSTQALYAA